MAMPTDGAIHGRFGMTGLLRAVRSPCLPIALAVLCVTGVLLWTESRRSRLSLAGLTLGSIALAVLSTLKSL